jgi:glycine transporter
MLSSVGGGAIRDVVVLRRVPQIFGGNTPNATCAAASTVVMTVAYPDGRQAHEGGRDRRGQRGVGSAGPGRAAARPHQVLVRIHACGICGTDL